jgi:hypothetical protein
VVSLEFEYEKTIPGTCVKAEIHDKGDGWWQYFLTNTQTGDNSGVHEFHLPDIPLTHEQAAKVAMEIWIAKGMDT